MREILDHRGGPDGFQDLVRIEQADEPKPGEAPHQYQLFLKVHGTWEKDLRIKFQKGAYEKKREEDPPAQANGVSVESLLAVVIDRLKACQEGPLKCRENACAITHIEEGLHWLFARTKARQQRGVEGTNNP